MTPQTWRTFGERVTVVVHPHEDHSIVEVRSGLLMPQLIDYGKNRANVHAVIDFLASLHSDLLDGKGNASHEERGEES